MSENYQLFLERKREAISLTAFRAMADAICSFEEAMHRLNDASLRPGISQSEFDEQQEFFERAKEAKSALKPVMCEQLDESLREQYDLFEEKLKQCALQLELIKLLDAAGDLAESGENIPTPDQLKEREKQLEKLGSLLKKLQENGGDIPIPKRQRLDALRRNLDTCLAPCRTENFTGKGFFWFEDGTVYDGEWKDDQCDGTGRMVWPDGTIYDGEWKNNQYDGIGKMTWPSGECYHGEWKEGVRSGKGKMTWPDGTVYEGEWRDDKFNGKGKQILSDGTVYEGEWENNIFQDRGIGSRANRKK